MTVVISKNIGYTNVQNIVKVKPQVIFLTSLSLE